MIVGNMSLLNWPAIYSHAHITGKLGFFLCSTVFKWYTIGLANSLFLILMVYHRTGTLSLVNNTITCPYNDTITCPYNDTITCSYYNYYFVLL